MRWSEEQLEAVQARLRQGPKHTPPAPAARAGRQRKHKFNAKAKVSSGVRHDSTAEAKRWEELQLAERAGEVKELERQIRVRLEHSEGQPYLIRSDGYPNGRRATHVIDFRYRERDPSTGAWSERLTYEDVKGFDTALGRLKRAIAERMIGTQIRLIRKQRRSTRKVQWQVR